MAGRGGRGSSSLGVLAALLIDAFGSKEIAISGVDGLDAPHRQVGQIADLIFTSYVVPFEVVSILLLAALVGAVVIARRD